MFLKGVQKCIFIHYFFFFFSTHLGHAKPRTRRQQREQQQLYPRAHLAAQPRASPTDRAFMEARASLSPQHGARRAGGGRSGGETAARFAELRASVSSVPCVAPLVSGEVKRSEEALQTLYLSSLKNTIKKKK